MEELNISEPKRGDSGRTKCLTWIPLWSAALLLFCIVCVLGTYGARDFIFQKNTPKHCDSDTFIMHHYCAQTTHLAACFDTVNGVERLLRNQTAAAIFAELNKLEPQLSPPFFWAVDQSGENENSHLDTSIAGTADYFNNNAYFYNVEQNKRVTLCGGGWNYGFWKTLPQHTNGTSRLSMQIQYCEDNEANVRVCGAFAVTPLV